MASKSTTVIHRYMLRNVSYNNPEIKREIETLIGAPYSLWERIKMNGNGSPKMLIHEASPEIAKLLNVDNYRNFANIELRPKGILIGFRSRLESYALCIPYYKLVVYKGTKDIYSIYADSGFVKVGAHSKDRPVHSFMQRITALKAAHTTTRIEDL